MSTEHQQYSTENQSVAIDEYAKARGMEIVRTYADHGKSGLNLAGRAGLKNLLKDVSSGASDFEAILVYDVSRWGRFQDADHSAYYEYVLKQSGIRVHYCGEPFENDGSLSSDLIKTLKRTMAGEYSRELSVKVFAGQCRLIELGFRQGGPVGYGLRRHLVDQDRVFKQVLQGVNGKAYRPTVSFWPLDLPTRWKSCNEYFGTYRGRRQRARDQRATESGWCAKRSQTSLDEGGSASGTH